MTTVLHKLSLSAYRGVSGLVLGDLTPVSLVVGANNSGKSSILEAAGLFAAHGSGSSRFPNRARRHARRRARC
jgi:AAA15 family ATPase/GTPase